MSEDPRDLLSHGAMTLQQVLVVAITVGLTALDGFDVLAISFAAPGIARDWGIDRAALGFVLSAELFGMAVGSILIGGLADRVGRRRTMLGCVVVMTLGMAMAASAKGVYVLGLWRVVTGLGIGGILPASAAAAAEFASLKRRDLSVSLMAIGYPFGAIAGGLVVAALLKTMHWNVIFEFGAGVTALFIPIVWYWVPESISWLCARQPPGALERVNGALARIGRASIERLPPPAPAANGAQPVPSPGAGTGARRAGGIFRADLVMTTTLVTLTYFLHITTFYFLVKWVPKIVVDLGFAPSAAAGVLVWTNVGGMSGGAVLGLLTRRFSARALTIVLLVFSTVTVALFGRSQPDLARLSFVCAAAGFCTNGAIVGIYAVLARVFPTDLRASGTGFAIGLGRGGAVIAPIIAGFLFSAGYALPVVAIIMGVGPLVAAVCLALVRIEPRTAAG